MMGRRLKDFEVYLIHVDQEKCYGCGECALICQGDVFEMREKAFPERPENCLGCETCKADAITLTEI